MQKIYEIRQTALQQDHHLKEKCQQYLSDKGIRLPNTCVTIRKDVRLPCQSTEPQQVKTSSRLSESTKHILKQPELSNARILKSVSSGRTKHNKGIHSSIIDIYRRYPYLKLPKKSIDRHMAPIVSLAMGEVETFFKKQKLDMFKYIYKPNPNIAQRKFLNPIAKKKTSTPIKTVSPLKIRKSNQNHDGNKDNNYTCSSIKRNDISHATFCSSMTQKSNYTKTEKIAVPKSPVSNISSNERINYQVSVDEITQSPPRRDLLIKKNNKGMEMQSDTAEENPNSSKFGNCAQQGQESNTTPKVAWVHSQSSIPSVTKDISEPNRQGSKSKCSPTTRTFISQKVDEHYQISSSPQVPKKSFESDVQKTPIFKLTNAVTCTMVTSEHKSNDTNNVLPTDKNNTPASEVKCKAKRKLLISKDILGYAKVKKHTDTNMSDFSNTTSVKQSAVDPLVVDDTAPPISKPPDLSLDISKPISTFPECQTPFSVEAPSVPNTSKPEFIQSLGLTPALSPGHSKKFLMCKICDSVHQNVAALKKHSSRHRVCPFCKVKFKSVETKQNHINHNCEIKKITESPGAFVCLERIEFNLEIRKQYSGAFFNFDVIPGLKEPNLGSQTVESDDVIVLSDDDESQLNISETNETFLKISTATAEVEEPKTESGDTVRPIVGIHDDTTIDDVNNNLTDQEVMKVLISLINKPTTVETVTEIALPYNQNLTVNKDDSCRFKNLKANFLSYMVPVILRNGSFNVSYTTTSSESKITADLANWSDLPLVEKRTPVASQEIPVMNTTYPVTFLTSQVQSSQLSLSSIQVMTATPTMSIFLPNTSAFIPTTSLSIQPGISNTVTQPQTISNAFFSSINNTSIQATPLLQNYALSMAPLPIINNQVPVQTTSVSSTSANSETNPQNVVTSTVSSSVTASPGVTSSCNAGSSRRSLPLSKTKKMAISPRRALSATKRSSKIRGRTKRQIIKVKIGNLASCSTTSKSSKLRVKNIWELK